MRSPHHLAGLAIVFASSLLAAGCGSKDAATTTPALPDAPALRTYPALAYVPASPDAVVVVQRASEVVDVLRSLLDLGVVAMGAGDNASDLLRGELGVDLLDPAVLGERGLDVNGSVAVYLQGTGATAVLPARDGAALAATVQELVGGGAHESTVDGLTMSTSVGRGPTVAWATEGAWLWLHVEIGRSTDGAWLSASRAAAGAFALDEDLAWATGAPAAAAPPLAAVARLDRVMAGPARLLAGMMGKRCLGHITKAQRLGLRGAVDGPKLSLRAAIDVDDTSTIAAQLEPEPDGWAQVGPRPGLIAALNLDAPALARVAAACLGDDTIAMIDEIGLERGRLFVDDLVVKGLQGNFGMSVDTTHQTYTRWLIDQIPARSFLEQQTQFGDIAGYTIDVPIFGKHSFAITDTRFMAGKGSGYDLAKVAGTPGRAATNLGHASLRPTKFADGTWRYFLGQAGIDGDEANMIVELMRAWELLAVDASITTGEIIVTLDAVAAP